MDGTTIAALSSPPGPARRGVLRLSGPAAADIVGRAFRPSDGERTRALDPATDLARRAALQGRFDDGGGTQPALLLWMPGPRSSTREDVAELHLPGAAPLLELALERVLELGAAAAAPGEFTRRAFLHGRLDLVQAEGVLELVLASDEAERRAGALLLDGGLSRRVAGLRALLDDLRATCEVSLDFDEADVGHVPATELLTRLDELERELGAAHAWEVERQPPRALPRVVLVGAPNAGKSSLFNALVGEGEALVSEWAGTTRDYLVGAWSLDGAEVLLVDTPGLDAGARGADARAQALAARARETGDLCLWVVDGAPGAPGATETAELSALPDVQRRIPHLVVWSKQDLPGRPQAQGRLVRGDFAAVSARTGFGLADLAARVQERLGLQRAEVPATRGAEAPGAAGAWSVSRELFARHRRGLDEAALGLARAREHLAAGAPLDLAAEELRAASLALDAIEGRTSPEELLDRIFARFCLGK